MWCSFWCRKPGGHHRRKTLQEEYREFLTRHGIAFDELIRLGLILPFQGETPFLNRIPRALALGCIITLLWS